MNGHGIAGALWSAVRRLALVPGGIRATIAAVAAITIFAGAVPRASAAVEYDYIGTNFFEVSGAYTKAQHVSGDVVLDSPLLPSTTTNEPTIDAYSFRDGINTISSTNPDAFVGTDIFTTDSAGRIVAGTLILRANNAPPESTAQISIGAPGDLAIFANSTSGGTAFSSGLGTWTGPVIPSSPVITPLSLPTGNTSVKVDGTTLDPHSGAPPLLSHAPIPSDLSYTADAEVTGFPVLALSADASVFKGKHDASASSDLDYKLSVIPVSPLATATSVPIVISGNLSTKVFGPPFLGASYAAADATYTDVAAGLSYSANVCSITAPGCGGCVILFCNNSNSYFFYTSIPTSSVLDIKLDATAEVASFFDTTLAGIAGARNDPFIYIDPTFLDADLYSIIVSEGIANLPSSVPEPGSAALLITFLGGLAVVRSQRSRAHNRIYHVDSRDRTKSGSQRRYLYPPPPG
jgi:hypothetical protein